MTMNFFQKIPLMKASLYLLILICWSAMGCGNSTEQQVLTFPPHVSSLNSGTTEHLNGVFFEDAQKGYAVGSSGTLLTTTNGGIDWQKTTIDTSYTLTNYFVHNGIHYVCGVGFIGSGSTSNSIKKKKVDAFVPVFTNFVASNGQVLCFGGTFALNRIAGYCMQSDATGEKWENPKIQYLWNDYLYHSEWYGKAVATEANIVLVPIRRADMGFYGIYRINTLTWKEDTVLTLRPIIHRGIIPNWTKCELVAMAKGGSSTVVAVGQYDGLLLVSKDNGATWKEHSVADSTSFRDVYMTSGDVGFACGLKGALLYTQDGGITWHSMSSGTTNDLERIYFPTPTVGYVVGDNGTIIKIDLAGN